jgi:hypothetical protein
MGSICRPTWPFPRPSRGKSRAPREAMSGTCFLHVCKCVCVRVYAKKSCVRLCKEECVLNDMLI